MFRESALCGGEFRPQVIAWPGNGAIVGTVANNREAIGYAGIGYVNGLVKPLALARSDSEEAIVPDRTSVTNGRYPLARELYLYVNRPPQRALAELPQAFDGVGVMEPVRLGDLAQATGIPKPTVYRLLGQLLDVGAVRREGVRYRLGESLLGLGSLVVDGLFGAAYASVLDCGHRQSSRVRWLPTGLLDPEQPADDDHIPVLGPFKSGAKQDFG